MTISECIEKLIELKEKGYGDYTLENCEGYSNTPYIFEINEEKKVIEYQ